jgi:hypothetical protein
MAIPPTIVVSATELRQKFHDHDFLGRVARGELSERLIKDRQPNPPPPGMPAGTRSQIIAYLEAGKQVAIVHQYLLPNGELGASGLPDPKRLLIDGILHIVVG